MKHGYAPSTVDGALVETKSGGIHARFASGADEAPAPTRAS